MSLVISMTNDATAVKGKTLFQKLNYDAEKLTAFYVNFTNLGWQRLFLTLNLHYSKNLGKVLNEIAFIALNKVLGECVCTSE